MISFYPKSSKKNIQAKAFVVIKVDFSLIRWYDFLQQKQYFAQDILI